MAASVIKIIGGPALVTYRGKAFYSQGDVQVETTLDTFDIVADRYGVVDVRDSNPNLKVRFTPAGEWENLAILFPYASTVLGSYVCPVKTFGAVNTGTDQVTITAHGLTSGTAVRVGVASSGVLPAGLVAGTQYFVNAVDANTIAFYDTYAHAVAGGGTGLIDLTTTGTAPIRLVVNEPLIITPFDGLGQITFWNAAVTQMPDVIGSAVRTTLGQVEFEAFIIEGGAWSDSASRYTVADVSAPSDTSFDPTAILTQPVTLAWGSSPWNSFQSETGMTANFSMGLEPVITDSDGLLTRRLSSIDVTVKANPIGLTSSDLLTALAFQGGSAARGISRSGSNLIVTATSFSFTAYGAALIGGPQQFSSKNDRLGELTWKATRTFSTGVPNPLFAVA